MKFPRIFILCLNIIWLTFLDPVRADSLIKLGDLDADGTHTVFDLVRLINHVHTANKLPPSSLPVADVDGNDQIDGADIDALANAIAGSATPGTLTLAEIAETSPAHGENGVSSTRETIIRFTKALGGGAIGDEALVAEFAEERLGTRHHLSPDRRTLTLFYSERLPASAVIRVTIDGNQLADHEGIAVDADGDGFPGGKAIVDFETLSLTAFGTTAICGRVFASEPDLSGGGQAVNKPLTGVRITVDGKEEELFALTDDVGNFRLEPAPAGRFFVHVDGRTATNADIPAGSYYPFVGKAWQSVPNEEINVGNVYLPLVRGGTLTQVSEDAVTEISFPQAIIDENPDFGDVRLTVPPDALFSDDGNRGGMVGIAPVDPERLPGELPEGLDFPLVITVQTDGATNFDEPVPVCFPNLPDPETGVRLAPGEKSALWSFNHDTGRFEIIGSMTVSDDGTLICTDPGVGVLAPGWHGSRPGVGASGGNIVSAEGGGPGGGQEGARGGHTPPATDQSELPPANPFGSDMVCRAPASAAYNTSSDGSGGNSDVDPVYLFSGEFYLQAEDLRITGRGLDFIWTRKYRSQVTRNTAQGNGWDFSCNVFLFEDDGDLVVCDGNSRADRFERQADTGRWTRPELFREIILNADRTLTMLFENKGKWVFNALDGSAQQGKLKEIVDRNGNTLTLFYNALGQLNRVRDTLSRNIDFAYNAQGRLTTITDFTGRTVRYTYYGANEAGGNEGDLKSYTSPVVTGKPNGNDFPAGKTITYTYSKSNADERLAGNLLSITDAKGQTWLRNRYAPTTNPDDLEFDRLIEQQWGDPGDLVHLTYSRLAPYGKGAGEGLSAGGSFPLVADRSVLVGASAKTTVNDRNGHITEYYYDDLNRLVLIREHTGAANPDEPSSGGQFGSVNPPVDRLRAEDPGFYDTQFLYNADSLPREIRYPNGNLVRYEYESDINPNSPRRSHGNIRIIRRLPGPLAPVSDQAEIAETFEYATDFHCGGCGSNFVTKHTDGRGSITEHSYDRRGNRIRTVHRIPSVVEDFQYNEFGQMTAHVLPDNGSNHRRRDEYRYHTSGTQRGYLAAQIIDAGGEALTTRLAYDAVGNITAVTDPKGNDTQFVYNQLDQPVRAISREVTTGSGVRYEHELSYDANNNRTRVDIINIDENGTLQEENTHFTMRWEYDILNYPIRKTEEVTPAHDIVTEYVYDANRNLTLIRSGEAVAGRQPGNTVIIVYDERDLPYRQILASGHADQSTTQFDYDDNGNLARTAQGIELEPRITRFDYDGYDRRILTTDAMGNMARVLYDENSNIVSTRADGELVDVPGIDDNIRLIEASLTYDPLDRLVESSAAFFNTADGLPITDGLSNTAVFYTDTSQMRSVTDDNNHTTTFRYDTVNRLATVMDPRGNEMSYGYDANSNVVSHLSREKHDITGRPDELFTTTFAYDNLDRRIIFTDNVGNTLRQSYDSRDNIKHITDALGNVTRHEYDGLNRLLTTIRVLTDSGLGTGTPVGDIEVAQAWDDNHRVTARIDDNGNATRMDFDPLNRPVRVTYADGTSRTLTYDVHHNITHFNNANGNMVSVTLDLLNRAIRRDITPGAGVSNQTTFEIFQFDGLSRLVRAEDDDSVVLRGYDSLSQTTNEMLNGQMTTAVYDGVGNKLACTYPGGRSISTSHDELDRKAVIQDTTDPLAPGMIASLHYVGPARQTRCDFGNGTRDDYAYDGITGVPNPAGDFGVQNIISSRHSNPGSGTTLASYDYRWDRMSNKIGRDDLTEVQPNRSFGYDSAYRLTQSEGAASISYTLDGVHNRLSVTGGPDAGNYTLSPALPEPADAQLNQYTQTPRGARTHDKNGNLLSDAPGRSFTYDYANRMTNFSGAGVAATYGYDALGRRISKTVGGQATLFFYGGGHRVCEEQDGNNATLATYVYGDYIDGTLQMQRSGQSYYYHCDDLYSTVALSDQSGNLVEAVDYSDYGRPSTISSVENPYLFTGRRYDPETGFYYYRTRYLDPAAGRFTTRDTIGIWGDRDQFGNGYAYVSNNPQTLLDPKGEGIWFVVKGVSIGVPIGRTIFTFAQAKLGFVRANTPFPGIAAFSWYGPGYYALSAPGRYIIEDHERVHQEGTWGELSPHKRSVEEATRILASGRWEGRPLTEAEISDLETLEGESSDHVRIIMSEMDAFHEWRAWRASLEEYKLECEKAAATRGRPLSSIPATMSNPPGIDPATGLPMDFLSDVKALRDASPFALLEAMTPPQYDPSIPRMSRR